MMVLRTETETQLIDALKSALEGGEDWQTGAQSVLDALAKEQEEDDLDRALENSHYMIGIINQVIREGRPPIRAVMTRIYSIAEWTREMKAVRAAETAEPTPEPEPEPTPEPVPVVEP